EPRVRIRTQLEAEAPREEPHRIVVRLGDAAEPREARAPRLVEERLEELRADALALPGIADHHAELRLAVALEGVLRQGDDGARAVDGGNVQPLAVERSLELARGKLGDGREEALGARAARKRAHERLHDLPVARP